MIDNVPKAAMAELNQKQKWFRKLLSADSHSPKLSPWTRTPIGFIITTVNDYSELAKVADNLKNAKISLF